MRLIDADALIQCKFANPISYNAFVNLVKRQPTIEARMNIAALEAMQKQIPMRAIGEHYAHMRCPSCNHRIPSGCGSSSRRRDNWCNYCGQKLDWSEK